MRFVLLVGFALGGACRRETTSASPPPPSSIANPTKPTSLTRVTIKALGMYCEESCPLRVRMALADIPTVYELGFDLTHESVFISYDATLGSPKLVTKPMLAAIKAAGFDPWLAKESWPHDARGEVVIRTGLKGASQTGRPPTGPDEAVRPVTP